MAKARRPSIHDLSHAELTDEEMLGWQREMSGGTDRACVLVGAALLDQKLGECLVAHMRADLTTDEVAQLFSRENSPLSSLSSKTALAHSLEILDREQRDQLDTIRRIRNAFAHSPRSLDLHHPLILPDCQKLMKDQNTVLAGSAERGAFVQCTLDLTIAFAERRRVALEARVSRLQGVIEGLKNLQATMNDPTGPYAPKRS